jgi:type II secretory pathway pseudopilin PulG
MERRWTSRVNASRGLSLVEGLVVAVIFALLGGIAFAVAQSGEQTWLRIDARLASLTEAQRALNHLSEDLRRAHQAGLACGPGSTLTATVTPVAGPPDVVVTYTLDGTGLVRQVGAEQTVIASGLTAFTPTCSVGGPLVRVNLTTRTNVWHGPTTLTAQVMVHNP